MTSAAFSIEDNDTVIQYTSTGESAFAYDFPILSTDELKVSVDQELLTYSTHYTVSGVGDAGGGTVTITAGTTAGQKVTLWQDMPIERATGFDTGAAVLLGAALNTEVVRLMRIAQQNRRDIQNSLRLATDDPTSATQMILPAPSSRGGKFLKFADDATAAPEMADLADATLVTLSQSTISDLLWPLNSVESAAGLTEDDILNHWPYGDARRYGAVGDNATDDTAALINAGKANLRVFIHPSLICRVTGTLATGIQTGQTWYGGGKITTADGFNFEVFDISGKTDVTVDGLVAESGTLGAAYSSATARFFRAVSSSHRCKLINCKITGFQSPAQLSASTHCRVEGNAFISPYGWGGNIQTGAHDAVFAHNVITDVANEHGCYVAGSYGDNVRSAKIHHNVFTGCAVDGVKVSYSDDADVHDNHSYENTGEGVYVTIGANRTNVHDNTVALNNSNGVLVYTAAGTAMNPETMDGNRVHHNTVRKNDKDGIRVQIASANATISNTDVESNDVDDNNQDAGSFRGISLSYTSGTITGTRVRSNNVRNEDTGINIAANFTEAEVAGNRFSGNTTNISDAGTDTLMSDNLEGVSETVTGTVTLSLYTKISKLDSSGGAVTATMPDGLYDGHRKKIVMPDATTSSTVSVTSHVTSDPEVFTFADVTDVLLLEWEAELAQWRTVFNNGVAT